MQGRWRQTSGGYSSRGVGASRLPPPCPAEASREGAGTKQECKMTTFKSRSAIVSPKPVLPNGDMCVYSKLLASHSIMQHLTQVMDTGNKSTADFRYCSGVVQFQAHLGRQ